MSSGTNRRSRPGDRLRSGSGPAHLPPDLPAVAVHRVGDAPLADAVQVADTPLQLLKGLLGREPIPLGLLLARARAIRPVPGHSQASFPCFAGDTRGGNAHTPSGRARTAAAPSARCSRSASSPRTGRSRARAA